LVFGAAALRVKAARDMAEEGVLPISSGTQSNSIDEVFLREL
jgi:hypothetical protein